MRRCFLLLTVFLISWLSAGTDEAYRAYKKRDYTESFRLYREAYKHSGSTKAAYNLGVFYEKGIGVKKNLKEALRYYEEVETAAMNLYSSKAICSDRKMLPYYKKSLKKLYQYAHSGYAVKLLQSIEDECAETQRKPSEPYLSKCPAASIIPRADRNDLAYYDCALFKRYPKLMKRYLRLDRERRIALARAEASGSRDRQAARRAKAAHRRIRKLVVPLMRYELQRAIACTRKASTFGEAGACRMNYIRFADKVMGCEPTFEGCGFDPNPEESCRRQRLHDQKPLDAAHKREMIERLHSKLTQHDYFTGDCDSLYQTL
ncbi:SEL1-like repeat protein [Nitratifractor salsuginis]|uniref:beta-lactamase n=1 Tax=Nitratifractor salsuginis (strain DSM 16511 / JCM 12458 / E9I37-1) TaxID=749222 RepID=E6X143_NITSE|nr:SEL1-like repeat protein [Nitratifractor salsuginis]ADV45846.1 Sel1 domain protein repeat-containing protein [Nitratifractor salsuginis DSM 16511]